MNTNIIDENEFTPIPGYEGLYEINRLGEIYSVERIIITCTGKRYHLKRKKRTILTNAYGYLKLILSKDGKQHHLRHHRLIATVYIPNPDNLPYVNHIDGDKKNNSISNLEWITHTENMRHAEKMGLTRNSTSSYGLVDRLPEILEKIKGGVRISNIAKEIGCSSHTIYYAFSKSPEHKRELDEFRKFTNGLWGEKLIQKVSQITV